MTGVYYRCTNVKVDVITTVICEIDEDDVTASIGD